MAKLATAHKKSLSENLWKNKIVGFGEESPDKLVAHPFNFRKHPAEQQRWLKASLDDVGFIAPVIVNRTTGHVLDGHARIEMAMRENQATVPTAYVELTEQEEKRALAVFDRITKMAHEDLNVLDDLLADIDTTGDLPLDDILGSQLAPQLPEDDIEIEEFFEILVICKDEHEQMALLKRFDREGIECRALIS